MIPGTRTHCSSHSRLSALREKQKQKSRKGAKNFSNVILMQQPQLRAF